MRRPIRRESRREMTDSLTTLNALELLMLYERSLPDGYGEHSNPALQIAVENEIRRRDVELADLRAAYEALAAENRCMAQDLDTWRVVYEGDKLAEQAEGR
jgi:hypothetical protein